MKLEKLTAKINPHEIQWRIQSTKNGKTTVVPYLTNRCVMERFDEEFGVMRWKNEFVEWRGKGVKCGISARDEASGEWITKYDGADETNIESTKGGFSDSMKRSAVQWGLGRDLYEYPMIQIEGETKYLSRNHEAELNKIAQRILNGENLGDYVKIGGAKQTPQPKAQPKSKPVIKFGTPEFDKVVNWIIDGVKNKDGKIVHGTIERAKELYQIDEEELKKVIMVKTEM
jgi:hypothetical protein